MATGLAARKNNGSNSDKFNLEIQANKFLNADKTINIQKCLEEVHRRAREVAHNPTYRLSPERFRRLATEDGKMTLSTVREAITVAQGEA